MTATIEKEDIIFTASAASKVKGLIEEEGNIRYIIGDCINDDEFNNDTGQEISDDIPDADMIDESLFYPFNAMDDFSHIRFQLQYFF